MGAHAPEQRLLVSVRQKELEGVARQEDQPEPLAEFERARIAPDPAYRQTGGLAAREFQHTGDYVQAGNGEPLPGDGDGDPARTAGDLEHRAAGLPRERRVERNARVA
jgi:hypothetical protein